jgi:hypothetical protein
LQSNLIQDPKTKKWSRTGPKKLLVSPASATLGRPWEKSDDFKVSIDADHSDMVKFTQFDQDGLVKALDVLRAFADEAIPVVENRVMKRASTGMLGLIWLRLQRNTSILHFDPAFLLDIIQLNSCSEK